MEYIDDGHSIMELNNLKAFVAVASNGSFSTAAERLHLTQPAVSKRISALEQALDTRLFDRIGRMPHLTEAGKALLPRAQAMIAAMEEIRRTLANLGDQVAGPLAMATSHHIGLHRLPGILRGYAARYPEVELDLHFMDSESACRLVEEGRIDLAVVTLPNTPSPLLELRLVWRDPLCFVVGHTHPLADRKRVPLETLLDYPAVLPERGTYTREILERQVAPTGRSIRTGLATNYLETLKMMTAVGLGWSLLPEILLDADLVAFQVPGQRLVRSLGIVAHRRRTLPHAAQAMIDTCLETVNDPPSAKR